MIRTWTPACAGVTAVILICAGGPHARPNSLGIPGRDRLTEIPYRLHDARDISLQIA
jgi:hypothetical protein